MQAWAGNSPYQFVGFYLDAPCHTTHTFRTWQGKYKFLNSLGWGLIVVYVGRQQTGCGSSSLSRAQGLTDGADAVAKCRTEGFPNGAILYLDIEHFDGPISPAMSDYFRGWLNVVLSSGFLQAGVYCAAANAKDVQAAAQLEYTAMGIDGAPSFWIVKSGGNFSLDAPDPTGCGVSFADVWQGKLDIPGESHNNVSIAIVDQNVANSADPSRTQLTAASDTIS